MAACKFTTWQKLFKLKRQLLISLFTSEEIRNEEWRDVVGYEGYYSVSNLGRMRGDAQYRNLRPCRILKFGGSSVGYRQVSLACNGNKRTKTVHSLVAAAFLGERLTGIDVNHIDGVKSNNRLENLEYVTRSQNALHAYAKQLTKPAKGQNHWARLHPEKIPRGENRGNAKLKDADIPLIFQLQAEGVSQNRIGARLGVSGSLICLILKHKRRVANQ